MSVDRLTLASSRPSCDEWYPAYVLRAITPEEVA